jgi:cobalt/nickel transport system permease protein
LTGTEFQFWDEPKKRLQEATFFGQFFYTYKEGEEIMHIPDNYLSPATCAVMGAAMIPVWTIAVKKVKAEITKEKLPMLGVGAAFSFLVMMFNVPLPGGTTGHAVGGTLLAILLGPWAACISVTIALLVQALLFGDGGILSFGANCFNMAFVLPFVGYFVYKFIKERTKSAKGEYAGIAIGSYFGINVAALCAAIEFGLQPLLFRNAAGQPLYCPYPLAVSIPAMTIPHLLVAGIVELVFTVAVVAFIKKVSPGTIYEGAKQKIKPIYALIAGLVCLSPIGLLAAGTAWGEWGADEIQSVVSGGSALGYVPSGMEKGFNFNAIMPDYSVSGLPDFVGYILSAVVGVAILIIVFKLISLAKRNKGASLAETNG